MCPGCPIPGGHISLPPPPYDWTPERTGVGAGARGQGPCRLGAKADGSRPRFHKSERTHSAKGDSSSDSSSSREAPDTAGNLGSVTPARETRRKKRTPRRPLWPHLSGGWRLKGDGAGFPLELTRSFSLEECGPMRRSPWRGGHTLTQWPQAPPAPRQIFAPLQAITKPGSGPLQEASVPRPGLLEASPHLPPPPSGTSSGGAGRAHRPGENRFTRESAQ